MNDVDEITQMLCQSAEDFIGAHNDLNRQRQALGQPTAIDRDMWRAIADLGWLGLSFPEHRGGSGMNATVAASLCEVLGARLFAPPFIAAALFPASMLASVDVDQSASYVEGLISGSTLFCVAWQEHAGQVEVSLPETRADDGRLNGRKVFVAGLEDESVILVYAQVSGVPALVAVNGKASGVATRRFATAHGSYCEVQFDNVALADQQPLLSGAAATQALRSALRLSRVAASAQLTGIARSCLEQTIGYVSERVQFGTSIGSFQSVQHRCVDLRIEVELADAAWREAARQIDEQGEPGELASVYAAKARASDVARRVGKESVQLHGAMGFTQECDIGLFLRASLQYSSWLGSPVAMRRQFLSLAGENFNQAGLNRG